MTPNYGLPRLPHSAGMGLVCNKQEFFSFDELQMPRKSLVVRAGLMMALRLGVIVRI